MWQCVMVGREEGDFLTERVPPGRYLVVVEGYSPLTDRQLYTFGEIGRPPFLAQMTIDVPESGEWKIPDLKLMKANYDAPRENKTSEGELP